MGTILNLVGASSPPVDVPVFTDGPVVTSAVAGAAVSFSPAQASGVPVPTITYEALLDGAVVGDETYVLVLADVGKTLTLRATASNGTPPDAVATSNGVTVTTGGGTVAIQSFEQPGANVAPAGIFFSVDLESVAGLLNKSGTPANGPVGGLTYDDRFHEIDYEWSFDDPGTFKTPLNVPTIWNNRNIAFGPRVSHVFEAPGTYTVTLTARDSSGNVATDSMSIVVADPDTAYPGDRTIYFDPDSSWLNSPTGATQVSTLAQLQSEVNSATQMSRVLIANGITQSDFTLNLDNQLVEYIGVPDISATKPILTNVVAGGSIGIDLGNGNTHTKLTIFGLAHVGNRDTTNSQSDTTFAGAKSQAPFFVRLHNANLHLTVYDCTYTGFHWVLPSPDREFTNVSVISDLSITNWGNFGLFVDSSVKDGVVSGYLRFGCTGCVVTQDENALGGVDGNSPNQTLRSHGPCRIFGVAEVYLGCNDWFSRNGWSGSASRPAAQPCVRANTDAIADVYYNFDRNAMESGGTAMLVIQAENAATANKPGNYLIDKLLAVATAQTRTAIVRTKMGGTFRNVYGVIPDVPSEFTEEFRLVHTGFSSDVQTTTSTILDEPINIYNCTILNQRNAANGGSFGQNFAVIDQAYTNESLQNNAHHSPDTNNVVNGDGPFDLSQSFPDFNSRFLGTRYYNQTTLDTSFASPSSAPRALPTTGSPLLGAADTGWCARDDILMNLRPATGKTAGAFQV